jgi:quercetin dioxygenase-like cupin family protein
VETGYRVLHLDEIDTVRFPDEPLPDWKPLRRELGITAFGTNAYVAEQGGDLVIERHDELADDDDPGGSEEIYVVVRGAARFTVDGTSVDVPHGGVVAVLDPGLVREAVALEAGTLVLAVGGRPGVPFTPSMWEENILARRARD